MADENEEKTEPEASYIVGPSGDPSGSFDWVKAEQETILLRELLVRASRAGVISSDAAERFGLFRSSQGWLTFDLKPLVDIVEALVERIEGAQP